MTRDLIQRLIMSLVDRPDEVFVEETVVDERKILNVRVSARDMAKVIGSGGRIFRALRTVAVIPTSSSYHDLVINAAE